MHTSRCSLHVGQLQLPIQHRVRAAAFQVYAAVQQGQGSNRQPVPRQPGSSSTTSTSRHSRHKRKSHTSTAGDEANIGIQPGEGLAAAKQPVARVGFKHDTLHDTQQQQPQPSEPVLTALGVAVPWQQQQQQQQHEQQFLEEGYVDEPWAQSDGYVPEPWEQHPSSSEQALLKGGVPALQRGVGTAAHVQISHKEGAAAAGVRDGDLLSGHDDQGSEQSRARQGWSAAGDVTVDSSRDEGDVLWLLDDESDGDQYQQEEEEEDGWLEGLGSSSGSSTSNRLTAGQQYAQQQIGNRQQEQQQQLPGTHLGVPHPYPSSSSSSSSEFALDPQGTWDAALSAAMPVLATYDVRYDVPRQPPFSSTSGSKARGPVGSGAVSPEHVSLTAAAAARAAKARHTRRQQAVAGSTVPYLGDTTKAAETSTTTGNTVEEANTPYQQHQSPTRAVAAAAADAAAAAAAGGGGGARPVLPDDPRWLAVERSHAAYLTYMQQLSAMVVSRQQQGHQVVYQVGICDHWLQLSHILTVFGGRDMSTAVTAAVWTRLTGIISRKVFTRMSHAERINYDIFVEQLVQQTILSINLSCSSSSNSSSSSDCSPSQLAATVYGSAVLGVSSTELITAVLQATVVSLSQAAAEVQAAADSERTGMLQTGATFNNRQQQQQPSPATPPPAGSAADVCGWGPSEVASLMWGLGTLGGQRPDPQWLEHMTTVSGQIMSRCQPSQLWGMLWGFARLGHCPPDTWLDSWLAAARQQLDAFNAEALSHSIWALAALQYTPDKLWLRAFCGMLAHRIRSFMAVHMSLVLPALSSLGYQPRVELCRTIIAQMRRHLHTFQPSQLCAVLLALASYAPAQGAPASTSGWHPGPLLLFDFISHSSPAPVMQAWSGDQAAQVLWAFSRFRYVPDRPYLKSLLGHLQSQLPTCSPDSLAMVVWGLAALKQPLPSRAWGAAWFAAAGAAAAAFTPQALAHSMSGMAALNMRPPPQLMQVLTRTASGCLSGFSCMELGLLIAALADLHWRPSDVWMKAFVSQVSQQLPAFENEDFGLLLYGLASLAQPLQPALLARLCCQVKSKLYGLSGEGLGLLVWGIAQYDYEMRDADEWWSAVFTEFESKWESTTLRGCALAAVGLAQLGPRHLPPGTWEAGFINRYKALTHNKPTAWPQLLMGLRAAAGLEPGEQISISSWMNQLLLQLGRSWNMPDPEDAGGLAAINLQVSTTAAMLAGVGNVPTDATPAAAMSLQLSGGQRAAVGGVEMGYDAEGFTEVPIPRDEVQPTSATVVLL